VSRAVKKALPWVLSLGFVAWLLWTTDLDQVGDALGRADLVQLGIILVLSTIAAYLVDSATLIVLFRRLLTPVKARDMFAIKGVSYFFNAVNYGLAAGSIALFVRKKYDEVGFLNALSAMMWMSFVDILVLSVMLTLGVAVGADLLPEHHVRALPYVLFVVLGIAGGAFIYWNLGFDFFILGRLRNLAIFDAFRRAKLSDYGAMMACRLGVSLTYVVMAWLTLGTFDIVIGIVPLLVYQPLLTFMQVVPAQISGLGAIQEVMILLLAPFVAASVVDPRAEVFAYSLATGPVMALLRLGIGYLFIANVAKDFSVTKAEIEAAQADVEPEKA